MTISRARLLAAVLILAIAAPLLAADASVGPLHQYVAAKDDSFRWVKRQEGQVGGGTFVELTLTSQTWRDIVWKHQLFLFKPDAVKDASQAMLFIGGGRWRPELEQPVVEARLNAPKELTLLMATAAQIKAPVGLLLHVPQQPVFGGMVEDEIISYTFEQYLNTQDATWPLLLPMVKSAVRGMDAMQQFAKQAWQLDIQHFTVAGGSKRGWTTWLSAAVDPRVNAIAPAVIDTLNMGPQMKHQIATWGRFSEQIEDYTRRGIQDKTNTEIGAKLRSIVDPYSYREILTQPKMILLGTNDRYWPLDALNLYWDGLVGEKHVLYIPNNGHGLNDMQRILGALVAINRRAMGELTFPDLKWDLKDGEGNLSLSITSDVKPKSVLAWTASAPTKDFREAKWTSVAIPENGGAYEHSLPHPAEGYAALIGEAEYETGGTPYFLSTNVRIVGSKPAADAAGK